MELNELAKIFEAVLTMSCFCFVFVLFCFNLLVCSIN